MELKEAKEIIQAGIAWANWTVDQQNAMRTALVSLNKQAELSKKVQLLEFSLKEYKEENDKYESSTHIDNFQYEFEVRDSGEIICQINVHGIEHTFGITEKDSKSFAHIFQMNK
jgi:hypothetical protein